MKELKVERVAMDRDVTIPGDGSITYTVFKKTGENTWESCGEYIDNEADALLFAAAQALLNACKELVKATSTGQYIASASLLGQAAIARATEPLKRG